MVPDKDLVGASFSLLQLQWNSTCAFPWKLSCVIFFHPYSGIGCIRSGWVLAVAAVPPAASTKGEAFLCILPDLPFKNLRDFLETTLKGNGKYLVCVALSIYAPPLVHTRTYYFITNFQFNLLTSRTGFWQHLSKVSKCSLLFLPANDCLFPNWVTLLPCNHSSLKGSNKVTIFRLSFFFCNVVVRGVQCRC